MLKRSIERRTTNFEMCWSWFGSLLVLASLLWWVLITFGYGFVGSPLYLVGLAKLVLGPGTIMAALIVVSRGKPSRHMAALLLVVVGILLTVVVVLDGGFFGFETGLILDLGGLGVLGTLHAICWRLTLEESSATGSPEVVDAGK